MTAELDNQIVKELIEVMKIMQDYIKEKNKKTEEELIQLSSAITELYKSLRGFWGLLAGIANNRLMIIQSAIPPLFQNTETKAKIEEAEREYNKIESLVQRLDSFWVQLFETPDYAEPLLLRDKIQEIKGRLQEILDEIYTHEERFLKLTDEIWKEYLEWKKEREKEIK